MLINSTAADSSKPGTRPDRDKATGDGMDLYALEQLLSDVEQQPEWRSDADKAAAYYDNKQLSAGRLQELADSGEPPTIVNLMSGAINGVLGQEAKTRLDWRAEADSDQFQDVADVLNDRLQEAKRESKADQSISDAYKGQCVPGIGWVEVSRNPDPLAYPYRAMPVHRNEVWWDWRCNLMFFNETSKWVLRQKWVDLDEAESTMPQFRDIFELGCNTGPITDAMASTILRVQSFDSVRQLESVRRQFNRFEEEWLDNSSRRRVRFYDVYYKQPKTVVALVAGSKRVRFNPSNPYHVAMVQRGIAMLVKGPSYVIRHARFAGPFRLFDIELKGRCFPLIPFVGFVDDEFATPYGLAAGMIDPQDEYNERRSRLRWLLKACQVFVDDDALSTKYNNFVDLAKEVMRPDAMFVMNAMRRNPASGLRIEHNGTLAREQVDVMQDAKQLIQEQPRIYSSMLGDAPTGVTSGLAINSLVEQGMIAMGETNDNYRGSRAQVGEAVMEMICEDLARPNMQILLGKGKRARVVVLNTVDQNKMPVNCVEDAPVKLGLGDVPSTAAHKLQQQQHLSQMLQSVGPDPIARAVVMPALIESTDLPNREADAEWMRQQYGSPTGENPQDDPAAQAKMAAQQQAQAMAMEEQKRKLDELTAKAEKLHADAMLSHARVGEIMSRLSNPQPAAAPPAPAEPDPMAHINDALNEAAQPA
jgi:hypothetical protein